MSGHSTEERGAVVLDTRRRRTREDKEAILAELNQAGATVSAVARRHGVSPALVFRWRKDLAGEVGKAAGLVPAVLSGRAAKALAPSGMMEIELLGGVRIRLDGSVDGAALKRVIDIVERR